MGEKRGKKLTTTPSRYPKFSDFEKSLFYWLKNEMVVPSVFDPNFSKDKVGFNITKGRLQFNPKLYVFPMLIHECSHVWLILKKSYYRDLTAKRITPEYKKYSELSRGVGYIVELEMRFSDEEKKEMEKILGKPETCSRFYLPRGTMYTPLTRIGNLIDETATLKVGEFEAGHPMDDFQEFFASTMTTLTYDGEHFFKSLNSLEKLSKKKDFDKVAFAFGTLAHLLHNVHRLGMDFCKELEESSKKSKIDTPQLKNLSNNLVKLNSFFKRKREPPKQRVLRH